MEQTEFASQVNKLIQEPGFQKLIQLQLQTNLFEIVAASHTEMWHSAFIGWLLDPHSSLRLGAFPLRRFLAMLKYEGIYKDDRAIRDLHLGKIESRTELQLESVVFTTEFTDSMLDGRIDIIGMNDEVRITIENKINARESKDQTVKYYDYLSRTAENFTYDIPVFLSPNMMTEPFCDHFIQIDYQMLCDHVIMPCFKHPDLSEGNRYLLSQYIFNLGKPLKGGRVMALANKELCLELYKTYREVFDEIFLSVKGEAPAIKNSTEKIRSYSTTLEQLFAAGKLQAGDRLEAKYKNGTYTAAFIEDPDDQNVSILLRDKRFASPSKAATEITKLNANGWKFWNVYGADGRSKGTLADIRAQLDEDDVQS